MSTRRSSRALVPGTLVLLAGGLLSTSARAQSLETFVMTAGGQSICGTFTTPAPVANTFGGYGPSLPIPGGLAGCGVAGDLRSAVAPLGPLADAMALSAAWGSGTVEVYSGSTEVQVDYGALRAEAHSDYAYGGTYLGTNVAGSVGFALTDEVLTITSPSAANGQVGYVQVLVTVTGGLSMSGGGATDVVLIYRLGSSPTYTMFKSSAFWGTVDPYTTTATGNGLGGFTSSPGSLSGSGVIETLVTPFLFGTALDFRLGLLAATVPYGSASQDVDFQAEITGILVFSSSGQPLTDFTVASASGTPYGSGGAFLTAGYCTAGTSASGCAALLSSSGMASATASSGFVLAAAGVEGAKDGLFFFGSNGRQANSWGNGTSYQCVVPPVKRAGVLAGTGTNGACNGAFIQDLNAHWQAKPNHNPGAGALVQAQLWYRDPQSTSNQTTSLSDALEFTLQP